MSIDDSRGISIDSPFAPSIDYSIGISIDALLEPDWFKRSGCGCGCGSLQMRMVAVSRGFKRFAGLVLRLEIGAFVGYL